MTEPDYAAIQRVIDEIRLVDIRLKTVHADLNSSRDVLPAGWGTQSFVGFDGRVEARDVDTGVFVARVMFVAGYKATWDRQTGEVPEYDPEDPPDVDLGAEFDLEYALRPGSDLAQDDLRQFAEVNAVFHAWPYWRELAQSLTQRMGIEPLVIGVFRAPPEAREGSD